MNREQAENLLAQLIFDELEEPTRSELLAYLQTDVELDEQLGTMRAAAGLLGEAVAAEGAPRLDPIRRQHLHQQTQQRAWRHRVLSGAGAKPLRRVAMLAACLALATALVSLFLPSLGAVRRSAKQVAMEIEGYVVKQKEIPDNGSESLRLLDDSKRLSQTGLSDERRKIEEARERLAMRGEREPAPGPASGQPVDTDGDVTNDDVWLGKGIAPQAEWGHTLNSEGIVIDDLQTGGATNLRGGVAVSKETGSDPISQPSALEPLPDKAGYDVTMAVPREEPAPATPWTESTRGDWRGTITRNGSSTSFEAQDQRGDTRYQSGEAGDYSYSQLNLFHGTDGSGPAGEPHDHPANGPVTDGSQRSSGSGASPSFADAPSFDLNDALSNDDKASGVAPNDSMFKQPRDLYAQQEAAEGAKALAEGDQKAATRHYERALQLNPDDAEARAKLDAALAASNAALAERSGLETERGNTALLREAARVEYEQAMNAARARLAERDFAAATDFVEKARTVADRNQRLFTAETYRSTRAQADSLSTQIIDTRRATEAIAQAETGTSSREVTQQEAEAARERQQREVQSLLQQARVLQRDMEFDRALELLDQAMFIDPTNIVAQAMKDMVEDSKALMDLHETKEKPQARKPRLMPVNPWVMTADDQLSTFALDVDTASYGITRRYIHDGFLPPRHTVRMEEFINSFDYQYPAGKNDSDAFAVHAEAGPAPFAKDAVLVKVGVRGKVVGRDQAKPAHLAFVIDTSGSMDRPDRLPLLKQGLAMLLDQLAEQDRVSVVSYGTEARLLIENASVAGKTQIMAVLDDLQTGGSTNLLAGVAVGYDLAKRHVVPGGVNRIILCSDGVANVGPSEAEDLLKQIAQFRGQGVTFTSVGVGSGNYDDELLEQLSNKGDGSYLFLGSIEDAQHAFVEDLSATRPTIAYDAKIQVEFNPQRVRRYRLIGYENRDIADADFRNDAVDAGEVGSGQSATALYEVELLGPVTGPGASDLPDLGTVFVRYRDAETGRVNEHATRLTGRMIASRTPSDDPRFYLAACAAELAEVLRGSEHVDSQDINRNLDAIQRVLTDAVAQLPLDAEAHDLLDLVRRAHGLPRAE